MRIHNPNCDGEHCQSATAEVRKYPLGGGANLILCRACFAHENAFNARRASDTRNPHARLPVAWTSAAPYPDLA